MIRNSFTGEEIALCTYIARFGRKDFDEFRIYGLTKKRSEASIKLKVQNIAFMLDEEGYTTSNAVNKLSGKPFGQGGRKTNWDIVQVLAKVEQKVFYSTCMEILNRDKK